ncbi:MAG: hypothetical protein GQE15_24400 [Archangiaceae bacterium]|nr:hypothetical protein [Archangiaceae bacterium]
MRAVCCLVLLGAALATAQTKEERAHAEAACKKQLPKCTTRSSLFVEPPHPCANRGAACPPELLAKQTTGGLWSCTCLDCKTSAQCSPGWACEGDGKKKRCVPGPPTNGPEPLPPSSAPTPQP